MKNAVKNLPVHVSKIPLIELLTEIHRRRLTGTVFILAKKFMPDSCTYRLRNSFHLDSLKIISELLIEDKEINDLRHICRRCKFLRICVIYNN